MKRGQNKKVMTIKQRPGHTVEILLREVQEGDLRKYLSADAELQSQNKTDASTGTVKVRIPDNSPNLTEYVKQHTEYCVRGYVSKATRFGFAHLPQTEEAGRFHQTVNCLYTSRTLCIFRSKSGSRFSQ